MMPPVSFPWNGGTLQAEPDSALPAMTALAALRFFDLESKIQVLLKRPLFGVRGAKKIERRLIKIGRENCLRCSAELEAGAVPPGARSVWRALSLDFATEWEISQSSGLSLHSIPTWLPVLVAKGLVVVIGTALKEPRYRKGLLEPKDEWTRALRQRLEADQEWGFLRPLRPPR